MLRQYGWLVLLRLVFAAWLVWAVFGVLGFPRLLTWLGLDWLNPDQQTEFFAALSVVGAVGLAFAILLVLRLFERRKPSRTPLNTER